MNRVIVAASMLILLVLPANALGQEPITPTIKATIGKFRPNAKPPRYDATVSWDNGCTLPRDTPNSFFSWSGAIFYDSPFDAQTSHPSPNPDRQDALGGGREVPNTGSRRAFFAPGDVLLPFIETTCQTGPDSDSSNAPARAQEGQAHGERIALAPYARPADDLVGKGQLFDPKRAPVGEHMRLAFQYSCHHDEGITHERCVYHVDGAGLHISRREGRTNAEEQFAHLEFTPKRTGTIRITLVEMPYGMRSNDHLEIRVVPKRRARSFRIGGPHGPVPVPAILDH